MKKILAVLGISISVCVSAFADGENLIGTGEFYQGLCKKGRLSEGCLMYMMGYIQGSDNAIQDADAVYRVMRRKCAAGEDSYCNRQPGKALNVMYNGCSGSRPPTVKQVQEAVFKYLEDHPKERSASFNDVYQSAVASAFPCP